MEIRLDSFISQYGTLSRRKAKEAIITGRVSINGKICSSVIDVDSNKDIIALDDLIIDPKNKTLKYYMLNKPTNILSTVTDDRGRPTVLDHVKVPFKIYPVGRLDYNSTGLILLTNDGDLALKLTHPRFQVEKVYDVVVDSDLTPDQISKLENGVNLDGELTLPTTVKQLTESRFEITLNQGKKRQIREMCKVLGLNVVALNRIKLGPLTLSGLRAGEYRELTPKEIKSLKDL